MQCHLYARSTISARMQKNARYRLPRSRLRKDTRKSAKGIRQRVTLATPTERTICLQGIERATLSHRPERMHTTSPRGFSRIKGLQTYAPIPKFSVGQADLNLSTPFPTSWGTTQLPC